MYETYTKQSLPTKNYRELLGTAICVFNSNNAFIIENILRNDSNSEYNWYDLIDQPSGDLAPAIKKTISKNTNRKIANAFDELVKIRNRIVHSYQGTDKNGEQILFTKNKKHIQWVISEEYILDFIRKNEELSDLLHNFRGY